MTNLYQVFQNAMKPDSPALLDADRRVIASFKDLDKASAQYANLMTTMGLAPGDRVIVQADKTPECLYLYLGCLRAGLIYLPINSAYQRGEIAHFVSNASPRLAICRTGSEDNFDCEHVLTMDTAGHGSAPSQVAGQSNQFDTVATSDDDIAVILYTSGTTGLPKGAMISHGNLVSNARVLHAAWGWQPDDVMLHALPIFHIHGLFVGTHLPLVNGSPIILLPAFNPEQVVNLLPASTVFMGVPTHYTRLLAEANLDREATRNMRLFTSGSAPLLPQTFKEFEARTGHTILERYGMTETGMNTSNPLAGPRKPGTVGPPLPGVEHKIVDPDGDILGDGDVGELLVRGPNVFKGYWQLPDKTAESFTADGYFETGDMASRDEDGYISIVGRSKDLVITGGLNVYPREIEQVIDKLPGVNESAVIGLPHADFGEAVTAVVVCEKGHNLDETQVIRHVKDQLANFKVPKQVIFLDQLPRNTMGKVQKNLLREQYGS